ncbi:spore germination protein KC [Gracilibacillus ureilyticus]|uniref:Spore germination protein KC n=1 Tax=Gracilibacillus ureilyticus TaxID=531814 RepID=A0A1H9NDN0_9BACI|nr:Ger(x)C family spore germination protein [Gracilibacillus ureilyticus]SER33961.1 spore germination protein KC [Gracilibacillus ureilyticus]
MSTLFKLFISLFICISLTGCWSSEELTEITLATGLAIDKDDEDGFKVTIQVVNPTEIAGDQISNRSSVVIYSATGKTIFEAIRKLTKASPRRVHLSHLQVVIFGEEFAREGIGETIDYLVRDHGFRTDFHMVIAKDTTGEELISVITPLEKIPAQRITASIQSSQNFWAPTKEVQLYELFESMTSTGKEAVMTGVYMVGDPEIGKTVQNVTQSDPPVKTRLNSIGIFNGDKLIGWLSEKESKGFNYITNNINNTVGWVECEDGGKISLETTNSDTKLKGSFVNGHPKITVETNITVNVGEISCSIDLSIPESIKEIEKKLEQKTVDLINSSVNAAKEFNSDIFGFGSVLRKSQPKQWEKIKGNWPEHFQQTEIKANVTIEINQSGSITTPIYDDVMEKTGSGG